jgi:hypothetical protein
MDLREHADEIGELGQIALLWADSKTFILFKEFKSATTAGLLF